MNTDRRNYGIRRDINELVRGVDGKISGSKIGTYTGQYIAAKILLAYTPPVTLPTWDVLAVLFLVLIAPEAYKQILAMRWGGTVTETSSEKTTSTVTKETSK